MSDPPVEPQTDEPQVDPQVEEPVSVTVVEEEAAAPAPVDAPQYNVVSGEVPAQVSPAAPEPSSGKPIARAIRSCSG